MRNVKAREHYPGPKLKSPALRMPRTLLKTVVVNAKERSHRLNSVAGTGMHQESPTQYAGEKMESAQLWMADKAGHTALTAGRIVSVRTFKKMREFRQKQRSMAVSRETADTVYMAVPGKAPQDMAVLNVSGRESTRIKLKTDEQKVKSFTSAIGNPDAKATININLKSNTENNLKADTVLNIKGDTKINTKDILKDSKRSIHASSPDHWTKGASTESVGGPEGMRSARAASDVAQRVKIKPESGELVRTSPKRTVKGAERAIKVSPSAIDKVKMNHPIPSKAPVSMPGSGAKRGGVRPSSVSSMIKLKQSSVKTRKNGKYVRKGIKVVLKGAAASVKALGTLLAPAAGGVMIFLVLIIGVIGGLVFSTGSSSSEPLSSEVLSYTPTIRKYAVEYGISEYVAVLQAMMMQESGGRGTDPMQASESPYNTQYANAPGAIADPEYSIEVGVRTYADCVWEADCENPYDMDKLKLSIQGYNYGNGYITWAINNHGGYSEANALQFSREQAAAHGWSAYGDPEYVSHVLRFYSGGNIFAGLFGNDQLVSIAKAQLGNDGGAKFWSWYGYESRVEWCACFVSWCADQCGLIDSGSVPKFSYCPAGIEWFQEHGKWRAGGIAPAAGTIIFFDWDGDRISDHVGIVERCEDGRVYTVEGNSGDIVREKSYDMHSAMILGYGVIY